MLQVLLITFVVARVAYDLGGLVAGATAVAVSLVVARWLTARPRGAVERARRTPPWTLPAAALLGLGLGLWPSPEPVPTSVAGTLQGVVVAVESPPGAETSGEATSLRLASPIFAGRALDDAITVRFELLDVAPPIGAAVRLEATLERSRPYYNPSPFPPTPGPLRAVGLSVPEPDPERGVPWQVRVAIMLRENLTFDDPVVTALHRALVLGDRTELPPELRWAYQDTGLAHLLAISGFNLAVLGWGLYRFVRWLALRWPRLAQGGRPTAVAAALALAFVGAYTAVIMPSDATDRAMLGLGITLGATIVGRRANGWRTLSLCFLVALAIEPAALMRPGFQLSFAATAALVLVAPSVRAWKAWLEEPGRITSPWLRGLFVALGAVVIADLATFFATAPLGLAWFGQLSPHGLWLNLLAIPAMSFVVFPLALVAAFTGLDLGASLAGQVFDDLVVAAAHATGSTSTAMWPVPLGMLACVGVLAMLRPGLWRWGGAAAVSGAAVAATLAALPLRGLELVALDVGHGDALALRLPDGTRVLIDTGGARFGDEGSRLLAERVVVPALRRLGFAQIDLLVITHADLDHVGAAPWIAARIPVGEVWVSPCAREAPPILALAQRVVAGGGKVEALARQPPLALGGAELEVLWPPADIVGDDGRCRTSENDASLVVRVRSAGRSLLLTGDIEAKAEGELLAHYGEHLRADVLKAPHHGSRTSSTEPFLDAVAPSVVLVSGELGRPPWPPHRAVLERYRARGMDVRITGAEGAVRLRVDAGGEMEVDGDERATALLLRWPRSAALRSDLLGAGRSIASELAAVRSATQSAAAERPSHEVEPPLRPP